jgi:ubiquinone/menaquinone biosynthesis C-methylase UbiE
MSDHDLVYKDKAEKYEHMISKEDYLGNIGQTLSEICSFKDRDVVDIGAGTGRLTCLAAPLAKSIIALDQSQSMLDIIADKLKMAGLTNWKTHVTDLRTIPVNDNSVDIVMAGWSICYLCNSHDKDWYENIQSIISEMKRVVKKDGVLIIFETYGTGKEKPEPPDILVDYFRYLDDYGFCHKVISTDYKFSSIEEAIDLTQFFFGDEVVDKIQENNSTILKEYTSE